MRLAFSLLIVAFLGPPGLADQLFVTVPRYWTGTYNKVWATAVGGPFQRAIVKVGGTVVRDIEFEGGLQQHFTLTPIIDSTHFPHGTYATIDLEVQKTNGTWLYESGSVVIKNRGMAWEYPAFAESADSHCSEIVQAALNGMGWTCYEDHTAGWDHESVENMLDGSGVHYVGSHGLPYAHWTSVVTYDEQGNQVEDIVCANLPGQPYRSYLHMRQTQVGDYESSPAPDSPPYNPTGAPQVSFAFLDTCLSGIDHRFVSLISPRRLYDYLPPPGSADAMNQAVLTWNGYCHPNYGARVAQELWGRLHFGMTVGLLEMI